MNYCIIEQTSGSMAMRSPGLIYLGSNESKVKKIITEFMETNFKRALEAQTEGHYYRPDNMREYESWNALLQSLFDELDESERLIIDFSEWDCEEPGFFCVYAREDVQEDRD